MIRALEWYWKWRTFLNLFRAESWNVGHVCLFTLHCQSSIATTILTVNVLLALFLESPISEEPHLLCFCVPLVWEYLLTGREQWRGTSSNNPILFRIGLSRVSIYHSGTEYCCHKMAANGAHSILLSIFWARGGSIPNPPKEPSHVHQRSNTVGWGWEGRTARGMLREGVEPVTIVPLYLFFQASPPICSPQICISNRADPGSKTSTVEG